MNNRTVVEDAVLLTAEDQLDGDTAAEFASFIDDMNSTENADAWITVMRIPTDARGTPLPNSKHMGQLFHEPLGTSSVNDVIERIRREFIRVGENSITVRIIGKQQGMRGLKFNRIYTIEKPNKAGPVGAESSIERMLELMQQNARDQAERTENFMREIMSVQATARIAPAVDPFEQMVKMMGVMAPIMAAVAGRPIAPGGGGAADLLATAKALKEVNGLFGGGSNNDSGGDTMSTIKAVAEAVAPGLKFMAAKAEAEKMSLADRLRRLPPPAPRELPPPPPPVRPKPSPPNKAAPVSSNNATPEGEDVNLKEMRENLVALAAMRDEGQSAADVAKLVVDNAEDDQLEKLYELASDTDFVAKAKVMAPTAIAGRENWFESLRVAICDEYETDPDADAAGAAGMISEGGPVNGSPSDLARSPVDLDAIPDAG